MKDAASDRILPIVLSVLIHAAIVAVLVWGALVYRRPRPVATTLAIEGTLVSPAPAPAAAPAPPAEPAANPAPPPPDTAAEEERARDEAARRQQQELAEQQAREQCLPSAEP